jgi:hypothetical protein
MGKKRGEKTLTKNYGIDTKGFVPQPKHYNLLYAVVDPTVKPTISAWCKAADISRPTYYKWLEDEEFYAWFEPERARLMKRNKAYLDNIGLKLAAKDFRYWEALQMMYGDYKRQIEQSGTFDITTLTDEEIDEKIKEIAESLGFSSGKREKRRKKKTK